MYNTACAYIIHNSYISQVEFQHFVLHPKLKRHYFGQIVFYAEGPRCCGTRLCYLAAVPSWRWQRRRRRRQLLMPSSSLASRSSGFTPPRPSAKGPSQRPLRRAKGRAAAWGASRCSSGGRRGGARGRGRGAGGRAGTAPPDSRGPTANRASAPLPTRVRQLAKE